MRTYSMWEWMNVCACGTLVEVHFFDKNQQRVWFLSPLPSVHLFLFILFISFITQRKETSESLTVLNLTGVRWWKTGRLCAFFEIETFTTQNSPSVHKDHVLRLNCKTLIQKSVFFWYNHYCFIKIIFLNKTLLWMSRTTRCLSESDVILSEGFSDTDLNWLVANYWDFLSDLLKQQESCVCESDKTRYNTCCLYVLLHVNRLTTRPIIAEVIYIQMS